MARTPELGDVAIRERIKAFVQARGGSVSLAALGREVFCFRNPHVPFLRQLLRRLFASDPQLILRENDRLELVPDGGKSRALAESEYVVVDVETTGSRAEVDRVIEVAAFRVVTQGERAHIVEEFVTLVNPERALPPAIVRLTGITEAMLVRAPRFREIAWPLRAFLGSRVLVAHNARFDVAFLNAELQRAGGSPLDDPLLCTLALSRRLFPELPNHRLPTVARHVGVRMNVWHRARSDAWATAHIFLHVLERLRERGVRTLSEALRFQQGRGTSAAPSRRLCTF